MNLFALLSAFVFMVKPLLTWASPDVDLYLDKLSIPVPVPLTEVEDEIRVFHDVREDDIESLKEAVGKLDAVLAGYALLNASYHGHFNTVKVIIDLRPDIDRLSVEDALPFASSDELFHLEIIMYILRKRPDISPPYFSLTFSTIELEHLDEFKEYLARSDASTIGEVLVIASKHGKSTAVVKAILETDAEIESSFIYNSFSGAVSNDWYPYSVGADIMRLLLTSHRYMNKIDHTAVEEAFITCSKFYRLEVLKTLVEIRPDVINNQLAVKGLSEASRHGNLEMFDLLLNHTSFKNDASFRHQVLLEYSGKTFFQKVYKYLLEHMDAEDIEIVRQLRIDAVRKINLLNDSNVADFMPFGFLDVDGHLSLESTALSSIVLCLFNISLFRNRLYASDLNTEPSLTLAEIFARIQSSHRDYDISTCSPISMFMSRLKELYSVDKSWDSVLDSRKDLFDVLPEEVKTMFQVSLRISDSSESPTSNFEDVTTSFITISREYDSISEAISSKFHLNANDNIHVEMESSTMSEPDSDSTFLRKIKRNNRETYNQIEIVNHPEILMFGIIEPDEMKTMKLDSQITIISTSTSTSEKTEHSYLLQAFTYYDASSPYYHMSYVRQFSTDQVEDSWFDYKFDVFNSCDIENILTTSQLKGGADTNATFVFYLRSDLVPEKKKIIPLQVPQVQVAPQVHLLDTVFKYYLKIIFG